MKKIKLAIVGCAGRMGNELIKQIKNFPKCELVSVIEEKKSKHINKKIKKIIISDNKKIAFVQADIIIDFLPGFSLGFLQYDISLDFSF